MNIEIKQYFEQLVSENHIKQIVFHSAKKNSEIKSIKIYNENNQFKFIEKYETNDITKIYSKDNLINQIQELISKKIFKKIKILTKSFEQEVFFNKKWESSIMKKRVVTSKEKTKQPENIQIENGYYRDLLLTFSENGKIKIRKDKRKKVIQIKEFIKFCIIEFDKLDSFSSIIDAGCGRGYLTFGLYDYLKNKRKLEKFSIKGFDTKKEVIEGINKIVKKYEINNLDFQNDEILNIKQKMDIIIALHACNVATDQAIFKGIKGEAKLIVCSPCCHQQLYPQIKSNDVFKNIIKYGVYKDRTAEMITDTLRSLYLQLNGYKTKIIDFVESSHSGKNTLLVAQKHNGQINDIQIKKQITQLKNQFNISNFELENLLGL